jgi:hypothetical protein
MGLLTMISTEDYTYVFFPVVMALWVLYTFFDEDDREHRRRNGEYYELGSYNKNRNNSWLSDDFDYYSDYNHSIYTGYNNVYYKGRSRESYKNPAYKDIVKRCKRGVKISLVKKEEKENGGKND